jgi:hypothetical protein
VLAVPGWSSGLLSEHIGRTAPNPCPCHGYRYPFGGYGTANGAARRPGPKVADIAREASASPMA